MTPPRRALALASCALVPIAAGCGTVLGIEEWDVDPGAGGGAGTATVTSAGGDGPSSTATSGGDGPGAGGAGQGGGGGSTTATGTAGGGGEAGCGVADTPEHCGACDRSCWGGGCEAGGVCGAAEVSMDATGGPLVAVHGARIAWFDGDDQLRVATKGTMTQPAVEGVSADANRLVLAETAGGAVAAFYSTSSQVYRQLLDGSDPLPLIDVAATSAQLGFTPYPQGVAVAGAYAVWFEQGLSSSGGGVHRSLWNTTGVPDRFCGLSGVFDMAVGGPYAFVVRMDAAARRLHRCTLSNAEVWISQQSHLHPVDLAAEPDGSVVYVVTIATADPPEPARLRRATESSGSEVVLDLPESGAQQLAVGGAWLYWLSPSTRTLYASAKGAGSTAAQVLRDGVPITGVQGLAADAEGVYWSDAGGVWALRRD